MNFVLIQVFNGVTFGMLIFLLATGLTLTLGLMKVANLAHGSFYMLGGYIGYSVSIYTGNFFLGLLASVFSIWILGLLMYRGLLQQRFAQEEQSQILLCFGIILIVSDLSLWIWTGFPKFVNKPAVFEGSITMGDITLPVYRLMVIIAGAAIALFLWWFQTRTRYGAIIRAGVDDSEMSRGVGININLVRVLVFSLGTALAGAAGFLGGPILGLYPGVDQSVLLMAIVVIIIGGAGSLKGALIGALFIGLLNSFGRSLFPDFAIFMIFAPMAIVLAIRPSGLFGEA
jgi:branched-chain amino acid transport system permease protein